MHARATPELGPLRDPIARVCLRARVPSVLGFCARLFGGLRPDGVDYVLVLLVIRTNIENGTTTVHGPDGRLLGSFTLSAPFDAALVDDERVKHGVTPVVAVDAGQPAYSA